MIEYTGWDSYYNTSGACKLKDHDKCGWSKCKCDCGHPNRITWICINKKKWDDIKRISNVDVLSIQQLRDIIADAEQESWK